MNDTVRVDIERDFDLRNTSRSGSDSAEVELTERFVILCELSFALKNVDSNFGLIIGRRGEYLGFLNGNRRVLFDEFCEYAAEGFDTERQRSYVEKKNVLYFTR